MKIRRRLLAFCRKYYLIIICITFVFVVLYYNSFSIKGLVEVDISDALKTLLTSEYSWIVPLFDMIIYQSYFSKYYHFLHLPKRMRHVSFSEMTSFNPDTSNPLSPDFSFHLSYFENKVTIFEDYGCGCIYRIYILPPFSSFLDRIDRLTSKDLESLYILIDLDGMFTYYNLSGMIESKSHPFFHPMSSRNSKPMSGIGAYAPFCYQKSAKIYYIDDNNYPPNILNMTVECVSNELKCPIKQYSSISYLKLPLGHQNTVTDLNNKNFANLQSFAELLEDPVLYGPLRDIGCHLLCDTLKPGSSLTLYQNFETSGVITSILLTVLSHESETVSSDWSDIFLIAYFDGSHSPQVNMSIESLFISQGLSNDFRGAGYGRMKRKCYFAPKGERARHDSLNVGYIYLSMPFWKSARMLLEYRKVSFKSRHQRFLLCYQITESDNVYNQNFTGHLHGFQIFHTGQTAKWREVVTINNGWGHLVALGVEIHYLRPILDGPLIERWAALQADPLIYIDKLKMPKIRGTGMEDYFSYAHGFAGAANTSYSFVGVPLALADRDSGNSWICYRQHILDPVTFDESLEFIMEGTDKDLFSVRAEDISYTDFKAKLSNKETAFSYLSLYYYKPHSEISPQSKSCDKIVLCDQTSLGRHTFWSSDSGSPFTVQSVRFIGDAKYNKLSLSECGLTFVNNTVIQFTLTLPAVANPKIILTRTFHMLPFQWNDKCLLKVNNAVLGHWIFPMGPTTMEYSLRDDSIEISLPNNLKLLSDAKRQWSFDFDLTLLTPWRDISYELCSIP